MPDKRTSSAPNLAKLVTAETPRVSSRLLNLSINFHAIRQKVLLHASTMPNLTETSAAYWENMRIVGLGPNHCEDLGHIFYVLGDVQDWLLENGFLDVERADD